MNVVVLPSAGRQKWWGANTAVSSEAWAKLREWAILAGKGRLLLSGSVVLASLKAAVLSTLSLVPFYFEFCFIAAILFCGP